MIEAIAFVRQHWKLALIAGLAALFLVTKGQRDAARQALTTERAERAAADRQRAEQERGFALTIIDAVERQAARTAAREPIIVHSTNTVREYAQTDAGRAICLGADRVRGLDTYLSALAGADPAPASGRAEALRAGADPTPAGR